MLSIQEEFVKRFNREPDFLFFCPGRVNLIGEHIDYNGGQVMPCAISRGTWLAVSRNIDKRFRFHCLNFPENADLHVQESYSKTGKEWFNYPLGVIHYIFEEGHSLSGLDMLFYGDLPIGAGLSSSASIEVLMGYAISAMFGLEIEKKQLALIGKKAENEFIGVSSGIMDQFAVAMGKKDNAILLNCDTLDFDYIPFQTKDHVLVIINSNKQRSLAESKYNERFAECGLALKQLRQGTDAANLCDITPVQFEQLRHYIKNSVLEKRALHVVMEQSRVIAAATALRSGDLREFGQLMFASHQSLKDLYEVSGKELDSIVDFCKTFTGCIGARMTGAGFGGCAIALVKKDRVGEFTDRLMKDYNSKTGFKADVFVSGAEEGVRRIDN